ncbi:MAG: hypothetical protein WCP39_00915 [Chlamydiota bacterium]
MYSLLGLAASSASLVFGGVFAISSLIALATIGTIGSIAVGIFALSFYWDDAANLASQKRENALLAREIAHDYSIALG